MNNMTKFAVVFMALAFLTGCASVDYVGDPNGLLFPDGSRQITTTANAGLPLIGNSTRGLFVWRYDPKTNKTEFIWGASSSGQLSMPDLSKVPLAVSIP